MGLSWLSVVPTQQNSEFILHWNTINHSYSLLTLPLALSRCSCIITLPQEFEYYVIFDIFDRNFAINHLFCNHFNFFGLSHNQLLVDVAC